jgi:hypothetical protein
MDDLKLPEKFEHLHMINLFFTEETNEQGIPIVSARLATSLVGKDLFFKDPPVSMEASRPVEAPGGYIYLHHLRDYFEKHITQSILSNLTIFLSEANRAALHSSGQRLSKQQAKQHVEMLALLYRVQKEYTKQAAEVHSLRGGREKKADLSDIFAYFQSLFPIYKEAAQMREAALLSSSIIRRENWREEIIKNLVGLPSDELLDLLEPYSKWPEAAQEKCPEAGEKAKLDYIALEHAARLCGAAPWAFKFGTLRKYRNEQKRNLKRDE